MEVAVLKKLQGELEQIVSLSHITTHYVYANLFIAKVVSKTIGDFVCVRRDQTHKQNFFDRKRPRVSLCGLWPERSLQLCGDGAPGKIINQGSSIPVFEEHYPARFFALLACILIIFFV